ncbi:type II secretion system protein [Thermodesulfovibrio sp. 1176]|uniref:type IV pilus modification PilV family protein n=1 Tax=Thermodesulfovibrio sp. 1176 TaxID=3043424 RepID=UPI002482EE67|nr:type II secretion system protein [Thermodesulfovibrio sp. 1176]MDI1471137.1 type II secretion system protein [Thermodesulfovibrio sp. 1176]
MNKNNKGFTLIELLVAMIIIITVMLGLLKGIIEYEKFATRAKMKDEATEIAKTMVSYIESLPYASDGSGINSILYANNSDWQNVICATTCSFFETEEDFYKAGSPDPSNPTSGININFRLQPSDESSRCACNGNNCPASNALPHCTYKGFSEKKIYLGVNIARLVNNQGQEIGKAAAVIVYYFEPFTNKYQQITNLVIREKK